MYAVSMSNNPPIAKNRIPKLKELYRSLGFGPAFNRPTTGLAESTHRWRKNFVTRDGISGPDLRDWNSRSTRNDLEQMAAGFVENGSGEKHWPLNGFESPRLIPEYPHDKYKIIVQLQQVFWQQNVNAAKRPHQDQGRKSASQLFDASFRQQRTTGLSYVRPLDIDIQRTADSVGHSPGESSSFTEPRGPKRKNLHDDHEAEYSPWKATVKKEYPSQKLRDSIAKARPVRDGLHLKLHNEDSPVVMTGVQRGAPPVGMPVTTSTSLDCQTLGAPSARNSQDSPSRAPKMSALMGSFRVLHADPFRPMLPVPHTDTMAPVGTIREADLYPVLTSDPEAEKTRQVSTTITDASNGTCGTQRATSTFSPPRQTGTDKPPGTSDARPLTLDDMVKPQTSTTPTLNTQEQAPTGAPFQNSDAQRTGRAHVSQSLADSISHAPTQIATVEAAQANGTSASELAKSDTGHPAPTSDRDNPKPNTSESHERSPVLEEAEDSRHLPASLGSPSQPMELQELPTVNTAAASKGEGNIYFSPIIKEPVPEQHSKVHFYVTTGNWVPEPPNGAQSHPPAESGIDIAYFIIIPQVPRPIKQRWEIQSLSGMSLDSMFEQVSHFIGKPNIQRIDITLKLADIESKSSIYRKECAAFDNMKKDFADDIMAKLTDTGNTKFTIWLEPDPIKQDSQLQVRGPRISNPCISI